VKIKDFIKIYGVILLIHLVAIHKGEDNVLIHFTKPLLLLSLISFYLQATPNRGRVENYFVSGLMLSWIGDILLMFSAGPDMFFIGGLSSFLTAHVFYALSFSRQTAGKKGLVSKRPILIMIPIIAGVIMVSILYDHLGTMLVPVILYALTIIVMSIMALNRGGTVSKQSFTWVLIGAALFIISDGVLAYNRFVEEFSISHLIIMSTYGLAQLLLVAGMCDADQSVPNDGLEKT
jgi:uncharacterized membrane protein YhhN